MDGPFVYIFSVAAFEHIKAVASDAFILYTFSNNR